MWPKRSSDLFRSVGHFDCGFVQYMYMFVAIAIAAQVLSQLLLSEKQTNPAMLVPQQQQWQQHRGVVNSKSTVLVPGSLTRYQKPDCSFNITSVVSGGAGSFPARHSAISRSTSVSAAAAAPPAMEAAKEHAFRMYGLAGQTAVVTGGTKVVQDAV